MARIILFGGHGKVALLTEPLLVERGDSVTAVIRNPQHAGKVSSTGALPVVADVERLDETELATLIEGHDAIVWSAGAGGGNPERTRAVDRDAAMRTMDAAALAGVKRYVMVSYFNSSMQHGIDPENPFWPYAEAKSMADEYLRSTDLDFTILGPSTLTFESSTGKVDTSAEVSGRVSRESVARVIVATLTDDSTVGRTIRFNDGDTPIAEAIRTTK